MHHFFIGSKSKLIEIKTYLGIYIISDGLISRILQNMVRCDAGGCMDRCDGGRCIRSSCAEVLRGRDTAWPLCPGSDDFVSDGRHWTHYIIIIFHVKRINSGMKWRHRPDRSHTVRVYRWSGFLYVWLVEWRIGLSLKTKWTGTFLWQGHRERVM